MGLSQQDRQDKITAYLSNTYKDALYHCKTEKEFRDYMENHINQEYKKAIGKEKEYYEKKLDNKVEEFLIDRQNFEIIDNYKSFQKNYEETKKMKELIDKYFVKFRNSILPDESSQDLNDIINNKIEEIKNEVNKSNENQKTQTSSSSSESSPKEIDKNKYYEDLLKIIEFYNKYKEEFQKYIPEKIEQYNQKKNRMENIIDKNYSNAFQAAYSTESNDLFKKYYDEELPKNSKDFKKLKEEYKNDYINYMEIKLSQFKSDIDKNNINQINTIFNNFYSDAQKSESLEKFKNYYEVKGLPEIQLKKLKILREKYKKNYEEILEQKCKKFEEYHFTLSNQTINKQNIITNFFKNSYKNIILKSETEKDFCDNFEKERSINPICENSDMIYKNFLEQYKKKFQNYMVQKFIQNNEDDIILQSSNLGEFETKFEELKNQNAEIKDNKDWKLIFKDYLSKKKEIETKIKENLDNKDVKINNFFQENIDLFKTCTDKEEFEKQIREKAIEFKDLKSFESILNNKKLEFDFNRIEKDCIQDCQNDMKNEKFEDSKSIEMFNNISIEQFQNFIEKIYSEKKLDENINKKIINYIFTILQNNQKVKKLNVILCGLTGAGKSTLINSILELENTNKAPVGNPDVDLGEPVTQETKGYKSQRIPYLNLIDTRGTELSQNYNISNVLEEVIKSIDNAKASKNPDNYIHCIWYCVEPNRQRIEDVELDFLYKLKKKYKDKDLPIIIVGTKANSNECISKYQKILNNRKLDIPFIPVLAQPMDDKPIKGLKELKEKTIEVASEAVESICYEGLLNSVIEDSKLELKAKNQFIEEEIKNLSFNNIDKSNIKDEMKNILFSLLNKYISIKLTENDEIIAIKNNEINTIIVNYQINEKINTYFISCETIFKSNFNEFKESKVEKYYKIIKEKQFDFYKNTKNENIKFTSTDEKEIKDNLAQIINNILFNKAEQYYIQNVYNSFILKVKIFFSNFFNKCYENNANKIGLEQKELIKSKITSQFIGLKNQLLNGS